jgi:hypothetical protein
MIIGTEGQLNLGVVDRARALIIADRLPGTFHIEAADIERRSEPNVKALVPYSPRNAQIS